MNFASIAPSLSFIVCPGPDSQLVVVDRTTLEPLGPSLAGDVRAVFGESFDPHLNYAPQFYARLGDLFDRGAETLPSLPSLASLGFAMLARENQRETRRWGCIWLTLFPSVAMVRALAAILDDADEHVSLRDQAAWSLGFRQVQFRGDALEWSADALALADDALLRAFVRGDDRALPQFASALRHVSRADVLDALVDRCVEAAGCIEAFATPRLARALLEALPNVATEHAPRIVRLIAATLRAECVESLLAYAEHAPITERAEALFAVLAIDPARGEPVLTRHLESLAFPDRAAQRAAWHRAHPGAFPTVEALRIARTTATLAPNERSEKSRHAAQHFAEARRADLLLEGVLVDLWRHVAWRSRADSPALFVEAIEDNESALEHDARLRDAYLESLAHLGRLDALDRIARRYGGADRATWLLATHGRPMRALALRDLAPRNAPLALASEALALFLAGRADLATRAIEYAEPTAEPVVGVEAAPAFPGLVERDRIDTQHPDAPALRALVSHSIEPLFGALRAAPSNAEPDHFDLALIERYASAVSLGELRNATVYLAGRVENETIVRAALEAAGAMLVAGPFGKTAFYVRGAGVDDAVVARLATRGAQELSPSRIAALVRAHRDAAR